MGGVVQKAPASKGIDPETRKVTAPDKFTKTGRARKTTNKSVDPEFKELYDLLLENEAFEDVDDVGLVFDGETSLRQIVGKPVSKFTQALYEGDAYAAIGEILKSTPNE